MHVLRILWKETHWHVGHATKSSGATKLIIRAEEAAKRGREALLDYRKQLIDNGAGEAWQAELPKAALGEGEIALGYASAAVDACAVGKLDPIEIEAPQQWLSSRSIRHALQTHMLPVSPFRFQPRLDSVSIAVAGIVAWVSLLAVAVLRAPAFRPIPEGEWLLAVHGEWSNRTRHVLKHATDAISPAAILVLGWPRCSLSALDELWCSKLKNHQLPIMVRPWSLDTVLKALLPCMRATREAMVLAPHAPYLPRFRDRVAILGRTYLGEASVAWWRKQAVRPHKIVYGHTGNADTTILELAQQATGHTTIHVVHGISAGLNFTGRSNVAIFRCGNDVRWHQRLGGYGKCLAVPTETPVTAAGHTGVLLLSNLAHPMNTAYQVYGTRDESVALSMVADAARRTPDAGPLRWKPHPALTLLPEKHQAELRQLAHKLGYEILSVEADWRDQARESHWVVATASTVVIELLEISCLPIMISSRWLDPNSALAQYRLIASTADELVKAHAVTRDEITRTQAFQRNWRAIEPARAANLQLIRKIHV